MKSTWTMMKSFLDNTNLYLNLNYYQLNSDYYVWINYESQTFETILLGGTIDLEVFLKDYASKTMVKRELTEGGLKRSEVVEMSRQKYLQEQSISFNFCYNHSYIPEFFIITRYDENNNLTEDVENIRKCEIVFEPTYDYYISGGVIEVLDFTTREEIKNLEISIIGNPDVPRTNGGSVPVASRRKINKDGKVDVYSSALMPLKYIEGFNYNKIKIIITNTESINKEIQIILKTYAF